MRAHLIVHQVVVVGGGHEGGGGVGLHLVVVVVVRGREGLSATTVGQIEAAGHQVAAGTWWGKAHCSGKHERQREQKCNLKSFLLYFLIIRNCFYSIFFFFAPKLFAYLHDMRRQGVSAHNVQICESLGEKKKNSGRFFIKPSKYEFWKSLLSNFLIMKTNNMSKIK